MSFPNDLTRTKNWTTETLKDVDLEGQLDLIIDWVMAHANESSGHKHDATENEGPKIILTSAVTGVLPIANGGTGQSTLATLLNLVYPLGSYYFNDSVATNPGTLLGFGTWVAVEEECLVGIKAGGTFDTLGSVSEGEETHKLTGGESGTSAHTHLVPAKLSGTHGTSANFNRADTQTDNGDLATEASVEANADDFHNNIQPSRVVYMWRRTV